MKIGLIIIVFASMALMEIPSLLKKERGNELATFLVLLTIGFTLSFLQVIGVKIPNPNKGIEYLIKLVFIE